VNWKLLRSHNLCILNSSVKYRALQKHTVVLSEKDMLCVVMLEKLQAVQ